MPLSIREIDRVMIEAVGTPNKGRFGANAILGASLAVANSGCQTAARGSAPLSLSGRGECPCAPRSHDEYPQRW
jgi:hypothetical protein